MAPSKDRPKTRKPRTEEDDLDTKLVREYLSGNEKAFTILYERYRPKLMRFIASWVGDREVAQDLVQEAFLRVYKHIRKYDQKRKFSTWIFMISANLSKNANRNKRRSFLVRIENFANEEGQILLPGLSDTRLGPERLMNGREAVRELNELLKTLPCRRRMMFILRRFEHKDLKTIAQMMRCPVGTVKSSINRVEEALGERVMERIG